MRNTEIRQAIKNAGLHQYEIARILSVHESTFIRWLRDEMPTEKKELVFEAIEAAQKEKGE